MSDEEKLIFEMKDRIDTSLELKEDDGDLRLYLDSDMVDAPVWFTLDQEKLEGLYLQLQKRIYRTSFGPCLCKNHGTIHGQTHPCSRLGDHYKWDIPCECNCGVRWKYGEDSKLIIYPNERDWRQLNEIGRAEALAVLNEPHECIKGLCNKLLVGQCYNTFNKEV